MEPFEQSQTSSNQPNSVLDFEKINKISLPQAVEITIGVIPPPKPGEEVEDEELEPVFSPPIIVLLNSGIEFAKPPVEKKEDNENGGQYYSKLQGRHGELPSGQGWAQPCIGRVAQNCQFSSIHDEYGWITGNPVTTPATKNTTEETGEEVQEFDIVNRTDIELENGTITYTIRDENGKIETLSELLKIRGVTEEIFYGSQEEDGEYKGIMQFLTVYNFPSANPNTASEEVLKILYSSEAVEEILNNRAAKGYHSNSLSTFFRVTSTGKVQGSRTEHTLETVLEKTGSESNTNMVTHYWNDNVLDL